MAVNLLPSDLDRSTPLRLQLTEDRSWDFSAYVWHEPLPYHKSLLYICTYTSKGYSYPFIYFSGKPWVLIPGMESILCESKNDYRGKFRERIESPAAMPMGSPDQHTTGVSIALTSSVSSFSRALRHWGFPKMGSPVPMVSRTASITQQYPVNISRALCLLDVWVHIMSL